MCLTLHVYWVAKLVAGKTLTGAIYDQFFLTFICAIFVNTYFYLIKTLVIILFLESIYSISTFIFPYK